MNSGTPRLGILMVGMGAISTTLVAGVAAIERELGKPYGALTQMALLDGAPMSEAL